MLKKHKSEEAVVFKEIIEINLRMSKALPKDHQLQWNNENLYMMIKHYKQCWDKQKKLIFHFTETQKVLAMIAFPALLVKKKKMVKVNNMGKEWRHKQVDLYLMIH